MPHSLSKLLIQPRQCASDWLVIQAKELADAGRRYSAPNLLIYGALEARNAIEQVWFEVLSLVHDGDMTIEYFLECRRTRDGFLAAIGKAEPKYRQIFTFSKLVLEVDVNAPFKGILWDLKTLKRLWHALSDYCHAQGHAGPTIEANPWLNKGYGLIDETYEHFRRHMTGSATALLKVSAMTPEARAIWESFDRGELDEQGVRAALVNAKGEEE